VLSNLKKYRIVLASQSPRRRELLAGLDIDFETESIDVEENYPEGLSAEEIPCYLAEKKAGAYTLKENTLLITADTIVWLDGVVYGKARNRDEAEIMLKALSGKTHQVITGVCITTSRKQKNFTVVTNVSFAALSGEEIDYYLNNYKPYDKAGSYGIQEWIGYAAVERIEGSYFNVMGLPIQRLYSELKKF
jgi:septum formation protein